MWKLLLKYSGVVSHHNLDEFATKLRSEFDWITEETPPSAIPPVAAPPAPPPPVDKRSLGQKFYELGLAPPVNETRMSHRQKKEFADQGNAEFERMVRQTNLIRRKMEWRQKKSDAECLVVNGDSGRVNHAATGRARSAAIAKLGPEPTE